jgi:hypothetical protein
MSYQNLLKKTLEEEKEEFTSSGMGSRPIDWKNSSAFWNIFIGVHSCLQKNFTTEQRGDVALFLCSSASTNF